MTTAGFNRYQQTVLLVFIAVAFLSCLHPLFPRDQLLQHIPTALIVVLLVVTTRRYPLSNHSFSCIIVFLLLHVLGARYVYSYVPYDDWTASIFGISITEQLGFQRNHYDRFVHFAFGVLIAYPMLEMVERVMQPRPGWAHYIAVEFTMASSMLYELGEWLAAVVLAPDWAERYLGQQGDVWDAHKDMALATLGAVISMATVAVYQSKGRRNPSPSPQA